MAYTLFIAYSTTNEDRISILRKWEAKDERLSITSSPSTEFVWDRDHWTWLIWTVKSTQSTITRRPIIRPKKKATHLINVRLSHGTIRFIHVTQINWLWPYYQRYERGYCFAYVPRTPNTQNITIITRIRNHLIYDPRHYGTISTQIVICVRKCWISVFLSFWSSFCVVLTVSQRT